MRKLYAIWRAKNLKADTQRRYEATAYHCAKVSKLNHDLAFAVHKVGIFGGPEVEQISRPDAVCLSEKDDCVIVKDGFVYQLKKEER